MIYEEDIEQYIYGALHYPLKDEEHLVEMVCLHFPNLPEIIARTTITSFLNRVRALDKR